MVGSKHRSYHSCARHASNPSLLCANSHILNVPHIITCTLLYICLLHNSSEEGHPSPKVLGKYCFSQKLLTGELSTAHGYPCASPTKRDDTLLKKTARSEAAVAEVPAGRSGRECRHTPLRGLRHLTIPKPHPQHAQNSKLSVLPV